MCCVLYFIQQKIPVEDFTAYHPEQYFVAYYPGRDFVAVCLEHDFLLHLIWNKILLYLIKSAFVSMFFLSKPLWPLPDLPILCTMSLPECEGPTNSTLCLLPELLEELQMSETVSSLLHLTSMYVQVQYWPAGFWEGGCWGEKRDGCAAWRLWSFQRPQHCQHYCILRDECR